MRFLFKFIKFDIELIILFLYFETFGCSQIKLTSRLLIEKFDLEQKKREEELIKKFYSDDYSGQNKKDQTLETTPDNNKEN